MSGANRRELLGGLGIAGASTLLWAFGCSGPQKTAPSTIEPEVDRDQLRGWLRDAVARLHAVYPVATALAVERRRTTVASDVLGSGVARTRRDGVVFTVRDRNVWREQISSDLTKAGIAQAVRALVPASTKPAPIDFGPAPPPPPVPAPFGEQELRNRVEAITRKRLDPRVVYGVQLFDVEDTSVWFVGKGVDREQRSLRVRQRVARAAWNGSRPVIGEVERGWIGELVDKQRQLGEPDAAIATERALELMTPGVFPDGVYSMVLDPSVVAMLLDTGVRALLTTAAARRAEIKNGLAIGASVASPAVTLIDDPRTPHAYGGFEFDDEGTPGAALTLIDRGKLVAVLGDRAGNQRGHGRRPGHIGPVEPLPSHLRLVPGTAKADTFTEDGFLLEGGLGAIVDPGTTRVVIAAARAREIRGGKSTGKVYPDVELVGDIGQLFAAVGDASSNTVGFVMRDERDGEPQWRSIEAPSLRIPKTPTLALRSRRSGG